jgi:hypothetical protein
MISDLNLYGNVEYTRLSLETPRLCVSAVNYLLAFSSLSRTAKLSLHNRSNSCAIGEK